MIRKYTEDADDGAEEIESTVGENNGAPERGPGQEEEAKERPDERVVGISDVVTHDDHDQHDQSWRNSEQCQDEESAHNRLQRFVGSGIYIRL